jgi:hypothetical protein
MRAKNLPARDHLSPDAIEAKRFGRDHERVRAATVATSPAAKDAIGLEPQLTPRQAAAVLGMSESWLAKSRMRGDGPPYRQFGRAIRYSPTGIANWARNRQRYSTSG